jgi:hypothetical protein
MSGTILGFTGTRRGMKCAQFVSVQRLVKTLHYSDVHHGGCYGADFEFHEMMLKEQRAQLRSRIYVHPGKGLDDQSRHFQSDSPYWKHNIIVMPEQNNLVRDRMIVNEIDVLIACPDSSKEKVRSGTWFTVRRAREAKLMIFIVYPDGKIAVENKI